MTAACGLLESAIPLAERYDVAMVDLDGVVYLGDRAVPGAAESLRSAQAHGMRLTYVTNNASRTPDAVAERLTRFGIKTTAGDIVTSAQAAAHYLADLLPPGARVLVVGTDGLMAALRERGLEPVQRADDDPAAVVQGFSTGVDWRMLAEGAVAINRGLPWVATNLDPTVPSPRGRLPGNGSLIAALRVATGVTPVATGKPEPTMHRETVERSGARRPLVVGDRLDTDIEGANRVGCDSLLVLTGVTDPADLLTAPAPQRPGYLGWDLGGLLQAHARPRVDGERGTSMCSGWLARVADGALTLSRTAPTTDDAASALEALRVLCTLYWTFPAAATIRGADDPARAALRRLRLS